MQACISEGVEGLNAGVLLGVSSTLVVRMHTRVNREKNASLFLPQLPEQAQLAKCQASTDILAIPASSTFWLKVAIFDKKCYFQP